MEELRLAASPDFAILPPIHSITIGLENTKIEIGGINFREFVDNINDRINKLEEKFDALLLHLKLSIDNDGEEYLDAKKHFDSNK